MPFIRYLGVVVFDSLLDSLLEPHDFMIFGVSWDYHIYIILTHFMTPFYYHLVRWFSVIGPIKGGHFDPLFGHPYIDPFLGPFSDPFLSTFLISDPPLLVITNNGVTSFWTHFWTKTSRFVVICYNHKSAGIWRHKMKYDTPDNREE